MTEPDPQAAETEARMPTAEPEPLPPRKKTLEASSSPQRWFEIQFTFASTAHKVGDKPGKSTAHPASVELAVFGLWDLPHSLPTP